MNTNSEYVISKNVLELITVANDYCLFVEKISNYNKNDIQLYFLRIAPLLYLKGSLIPYFELDDTNANERFVNEEDWIAVYKNTKDIFNNDNYFYDTLNPIDNEAEKLEIAEIVADIYQDLKDFILLYQKDTMAAKENAVFACYILFKNNWGIKITSLQKIMHYLVTK